MVGTLLSWPYFACQGRRRRREGGGGDLTVVLSFCLPFLSFAAKATEAAVASLQLGPLPTPRLQTVRRLTRSGFLFQKFFFYDSGIIRHRPSHLISQNEEGSLSFSFLSLEVRLIAVDFCWDRQDGWPLSPCSLPSLPFPSLKTQLFLNVHFWSLSSFLFYGKPVGGLQSGSLCCSGAPPRMCLPQSE